MSTQPLTRAGTAIGNLGQHTGIRKNGMPVFDHRLRVFEQVSLVLPAVASALSVWTDSFCDPTHINTDLWIHKIVCIAVLQEVGLIA